MRAKRSKQYRKLMQQYQLSFNFREPYQVLLDHGIIIAAARFKMQLGHLLQTNLHGDIKPMITQCSIRHLYQFDAKNAQEKKDKEAWIEVAKAAERRRCGHHELEEPLSELECMHSCVDPKSSGTNKHKYVIASQEPEIRQAMRQIAGVPIVYINRSVMILEPMAVSSQEVKAAEEKGKIRAGLKTRRGAYLEMGTKRKREVDDGDSTGGADEDDAQSVQKRRKVRGPKGPNPLSVKKSKKQSKGAQVIARGVTAPKAHESDVQGTGNAVITGLDGTGGASAGQRKRKRKRKPKAIVSAEDTAADGGV